jgi:enamine deaminase RidA (YjgF/YER057c/UK114 family)
LPTASLGDEGGLPAPRLTSSPFLRNVVLDGVVHLSGQLPYQDGDLTVRGIVGDSVSVEEAQAAARACALNALSLLQHELGTLDRIRQILRMNGYVASVPGFSAQPAVMDAASAVFLEYLGERGQHARTALGVASLPHNAPVEIELTVALYS